MSKYTSKCGIYIIKNLRSGKFYIGSAADITTRWRNHRAKLRGNKHRNEHLQRAWNKYGESAFKFQILEYCPINILREREQHYLDTYSKSSESYNIALVATAPMQGRKRTKEALEKQSETISQQHKDPIFRERFLNAVQSDEYRSTMSQVVKERFKDPAYREKHRAAVNTPEARVKLSTSLKKLNQERPERLNHIHDNNKKRYVLTDPNGTIHYVRGLVPFCKIHNLDASAMIRVAKGIALHHKQWKCRYT